MRADVVDLLRCPVCGQPLSLDAGVARCNEGHSFDVARQGYLNLLVDGGGRKHSAKTADTAAMVEARSAFLAAGHFDPLAEAVSDAVGAGEGPVVEIGAGTAFYLAKVLTGRPASIGVAVDISVPASRRAAKAHPRAGAVVADAWGRLPLADGSAEAVLVVFAPRGAAELARLLPAGGRLVVATPAPDHLRELVGPLGLLDIEPGKRERLLTTLAPWFELSGTQQVRTRLRLGRSDVLHLASMGPSAFHTDRSELGSRVDELDLPADVTLSVTVSRFTRR